MASGVEIIHGGVHHQRTAAKALRARMTGPRPESGLRIEVQEAFTQYEVVVQFFWRAMRASHEIRLPIEKVLFCHFEPSSLFHSLCWGGAAVGVAGASFFPCIERYKITKEI